MRPVMPEIGAVARSSAAVLAVALLALLLDSGTAAVCAVGAGVVCSGVALQDSPGGRVQLVLLVTLQLTGAVLLGSLTSAHTALFLAVAALWSFGAGMQWALGRHAGLIAAAATALLIVTPPTPPTARTVAVAVLATLAAGVAQAVLIAIWPPRRWRTQRAALAWAYRSLASDARRLAEDRDAPLDPAQLTWLRDTFADTQAGRRPAAYQGGHRLPERLMAAMVALRDTGADRDLVAKLLTDAAVALDAIAESKHTARHVAEHALVRVDATAAALSGEQGEAAQRFSRQLQQAAELRFPNLLQPEIIGPLRRAVTEVRGHLQRNSPILRHAVRLAVCVVLAIAGDRFAPIMHGHWIALTVLLVLRPETAHTYTRCIGRVGGLAGGIVAVSLLMLVWQPTGWPAAVVAVLLFGVAHWAFRFGYLADSAALGAAVVFLLEIDPATAGATLEDRLFSVVIGGGLAVVAHVTLPDDLLTRLHQRAGELLKTEIDYAAIVIKAYVHEFDRPTDAMSAAWQRAFRARAAFEAASGAARASRELRRWLRTYRAALNAVTTACTSLERSLPAQPPAGLPVEFVTAVDDYIEALQGAPPTPAQPWTVDVAALTAAEQKLREQAATLPSESAAARVLVAEVATITRNLVEIATTREPISAR